MSQLCPVVVDCDCRDEPILNRSQADVDDIIWIGECVFCGNGVTDEPPIGHVYSAKGCKSFCLSTVSQLEADLCAAAQEASCREDRNGSGPPGVPPPWTPTPTRRIDRFLNTAQGVSCASGSALTSHVTLPSNLSISGPTLTVAAGQFAGLTQASADAAAASYVTNFMNAGLASGDLVCCQTFWQVDPNSANSIISWPPSFDDGLPHSNFGYADATNQWDECSLSAHGAPSIVRVSTRLGNTPGQWSGRVRIRPSVASLWHMQLFFFKKDATPFPPGTITYQIYPTAANVVLKINGVIQPMTNVVETTGGTGGYWVWMPGYGGDFSGGLSTWALNLAAGELLDIEWQFTGVQLPPLTVRYPGELRIQFTS